MRAVRLVAAYEFKGVVGRRSFWLMTFLFPVLILALTLGNMLAGGGGQEGALQKALAPRAGAPLGLVDQAGLVTSLPPGVQPAALRRFSSRADAVAALGRGEISAFYVVPPAYLTTGRLTLVQERFEPLSADTGAPLVEYVLAYALTRQADVAAALVDPSPDVQVTALKGGGETGRATSGAADLVPFAVLFVLFFVLTTSSSFLLQSVTREKKNRTAELLLLSIRPRELLSGKILGLGAVALLQVGIWVGSGVFVVRRLADLPDLGDLGLSTSLLVWFLAFLAFGYLAYGSILAALGTLVPSEREGNGLLSLVLLPLMVPLFFNFALVDAPDSPLALVLSLFPLSAPVAMVTRLAAGDVPLWQPVLSLAGLALTAGLAVLVAARTFSSGSLLSSESLSWRRVRGALGDALTGR